MRRRIRIDDDSAKSQVTRRSCLGRTEGKLICSQSCLELTSLALLTRANGQFKRENESGTKTEAHNKPKSILLRLNQAQFLSPALDSFASALALALAFAFASELRLKSLPHFKFLLASSSFT